MKTIIFSCLMVLLSLNAFNQRSGQSIFKGTIFEPKDKKLSEKELLQLDFKIANRQTKIGEYLFLSSFFLEGANFGAFRGNVYKGNSVNFFLYSSIVLGAINLISIPVWIDGVDKKVNLSLKVANYYKGGGATINFNF